MTDQNTVLEAFFTFVARDRNTGKGAKINTLLPQTEQERRTRTRQTAQLYALAHQTANHAIAHTDLNWHIPTIHAGLALRARGGAIWCTFR